MIKHNELKSQPIYIYAYTHINRSWLKKLFLEYFWGIFMMFYDKFTYLGRNISSIESDVNKHQAKL